VLCIEVEKVYTNNATTANQPERRCSRKVTKEEKQTKKRPVVSAPTIAPFILKDAS
jgi:hypothetical protein